MEILRTPDNCFSNLRDYPFEPHYTFVNTHDGSALRIHHIDEIQIKRWKAFKRHVTAIKKNCEQGDIHCRRRQRQAILQWAYNPFI